MNKLYEFAVVITSTNTYTMVVAAENEDKAIDFAITNLSDDVKDSESDFETVDITKLGDYHNDDY
jgi:hypothetical protein